ncbi:competence/damage-inducible protein CinA [Paenibacillus algicola]|uniref:Putative competence-damage inducible protein n=1 Tax=Paenibacillus algicola TaxID=2565926 RepID=A0A4P8XNJ0_9BACL|nr:competence/damage-inducible protein A [Paenibacillus algicola]QCT03141.1 competence/damage-inducible protein CinA [Paenibacillus algicola]
MKAEIIAVGTELLLGQIVNTNAQFLSRELAGMGIDVYYQTVVGDNLSRLKEALQLSSARADIVILSGGLGPTQDDLTKEAVAEYLGTKLHYDRLALDKLERFFQDRSKPMTENNKRQALAIDGGTPLDNETGLAVGNAVSKDGRHYIMLPGPPKELIPMFQQEVKPWLLQHVLTDELPIYSKMLKFAGIGESALDDRLTDLITGQSDPTIALYAKDGEVTVRISTKADSELKAMEKLDQLQAEIEAIVPDHMYASQDVPIEQVIVDLMADQGLTLSAAESCTGGLVMETLTSIPGSATMLRGGVVCYTNEMKHKLVNVPLHLLEGENAAGAVSAETAEVLCEQIRMITDSDFGLSITGVAGPGYAERKPIGLVYIGIAERGKKTEVHELHIKGNRETIRVRATKALLYRLWRRLKATEQ